MSTSDIEFVVFVVAAFTLFGSVLGWASWENHVHLGKRKNWKVRPIIHKVPTQKLLGTIRRKVLRSRLQMSDTSDTLIN